MGIKPNSRGGLDTDGDCRVKGNIFAVGDVTQKSALYNVAEMEGRFAVKAMYLRTKYPLRYNNMSIIMFFNPEVAAVGLNETHLPGQQHPLPGRLLLQRPRQPRHRHAAHRRLRQDPRQRRRPGPHPGHARRGPPGLQHHHGDRAPDGPGQGAARTS